MSLDEANSELVNEFKTAANAVTKLFKLASGNFENAYQQGYMDALRHLLDQLEADQDTNVQQWAVQQLTGIAKGDPDLSAGDQSLQVGDKRPHQGSWKIKRARHDTGAENTEMSL